NAAQGDLADACGSELQEVVQYPELPHKRRAPDGGGFQAASHCRRISLAQECFEMRLVISGLTEAGRDGRTQGKPAVRDIVVLHEPRHQIPVLAQGCRLEQLAPIDGRGCSMYEQLVYHLL